MFHMRIVSVVVVVVVLLFAQEYARFVVQIAIELAKRYVVRVRVVCVLVACCSPCALRVA